jgi:hypothetical protein
MKSKGRSNKKAPSKLSSAELRVEVLGDFYAPQDAWDEIFHFFNDDSLPLWSEITVTGPRSKVLRFRNDAKKAGWEAVSFERLFRRNGSLAPGRGKQSILAYCSSEDPTPLAGWHGYARIEYKFEVHEDDENQIYRLLIPLSRSYPDLCFVEIESRVLSPKITSTYVSRGRGSRWTLPKERFIARLKLEASELGDVDLLEAYDNDGVRSDVEIAMSSEALAHWDNRVLRTLNRRSRL